MDIYTVWDMEADSWNAHPRILCHAATEQAAIEFLEEKYHHQHHADDVFWWKQMEHPPTERDVQQGVVRDYTYFRIQKITLRTEKVELRDRAHYCNEPDGPCRDCEMIAENPELYHPA